MICLIAGMSTSPRSGIMASKIENQAGSLLYGTRVIVNLNLNPRFGYDQSTINDKFFYF